MFDNVKEKFDANHKLKHEERPKDMRTLTFRSSSSLWKLAASCVGNFLPLMPDRKNLSSKVKQSLARFKHRTSHVPNLISKNNSFCLFASGLAHVKFDV